MMFVRLVVVAAYAHTVTHATKLRRSWCLDPSCYRSGTEPCSPGLPDMDRDPRPPLDAAELNSGLGSPFRRVDVVAETGSTNADLLSRSAAGEDIDGLVLVAEYQNAGRGRLGRRWSAPPRAQIAKSFGVAVDTIPSPEWGWRPR
jgi:hypothetical protein